MARHSRLGPVFTFRPHRERVLVTAWDHGLGPNEGGLFCCAQDMDCTFVGTASEMDAHYDPKQAEGSGDAHE